MNLFRGRSDVAADVAETYTLDEAFGVEKKEFSSNGIDITRIKIVSDEAAEILQKEKGEYVTVDLKNSFEDDSVFESAVEVLSREFSSIISQTVKKDDFSAIVVGLGNVDLTSDSVGPDTVKGMIVTKHIKEQLPRLFDSMNFNDVSAVSPGVLGQTGIESSVIVGAVTEKIQPDLVIVIDSLASHHPDKLCGTVQISNTGISPGSGVGNQRKELSERTLGVPVISLGVPTVVDTVTLTGNIMYGLINSLKTSKNKSEIEAYNKLVNAWDESVFDIFKSKISESSLDFIVTPKDIDCLVKKVSRLVSLSLNKSLHNNISQEDINALLN